MIKRNTIIFGMIQGFGFPLLFFFIFLEVNNLLIEYYFGRPPGFSKKFIAILAIAANLIPLIIANKNRHSRTMRGVMNSTLILSAIIIVLFWRYFSQS